MSRTTQRDLTVFTEQADRALHDAGVLAEDIHLVVYGGYGRWALHLTGGEYLETGHHNITGLLPLGETTRIAQAIAKVLRDGKHYSEKEN